MAFPGFLAAASGSSTALLPSSGLNWSQFSGAKGGLDGLLEALVAAQAKTADPDTAATATATGGGASGGSLAAGTYYFVFTEANIFGETKISPESLQLTVASTNIPRFTFPSLKSGNVARNLYLGRANGSTGGPYFLYASGITATTYDASAAAPSNSFAVNPPTVNSTAPTYTDAAGAVQNKALELIRAIEKGHADAPWKYAKGVVSGFLEGKPVAFNAEVQKLRHAVAAYLVYAKALLEVAALIDANPGSFTLANTGIGGSQTIRTFT